MSEGSWRIQESSPRFEVVAEQTRFFTIEEKKRLIAQLLRDLRADGCELDRATEEVAGEAPTVILRR